jgi:dipeptidyl-peptidase-4
MTRRFPVPIVLLVIFLTSVSRAQGTRADYDRSNQLAQMTAGKVLNSNLVVDWSPDGKTAWYKVDELGGKFRYVTVDLATGTKSVATSPPATAVVPLRKDLPDDIRSRDNGEQCTISFVNKTAGRAHLIWVAEDGHRTEYTVIEPGKSYDQDTYAGHAWIVTDDAGKIVGAFRATAGGGQAIIDGHRVVAESKPASRRDDDPTSPDKKWLAEIRDHNVVLLDLPGKTESSLTTDGSAKDYYADVYWSPDSKHLVATKTLDGDHREVYEVQSSPRDQLQPRLLSFEYLKPGDRIPMTKPHLFAVDGMKEISIRQDLFPTPWAMEDVRWDGDSGRFTFFYNQRGHQVLRVIAVDASTGVARSVIDETSRTFIDYAGKHFCQYLDRTGAIVWMSERDGWNHLYLYDAKTGTVKNQITRGDWVVRRVDLVDEAARQIWFEAGGIVPGQDPYYVHFCRVDFDGKNLVDLTPADGNHAVEFSPDRNFLKDTYSRVDLPPTTEIRRVSDGSLVANLETADITALVAAGWKTPERFVAKARDGVTDIYGIILRPSNFDPSRKYPVVEDIYAGPQGSFVPKNFIRHNYGMSIAELGFIVVQIDGMGTSNRSKAFHDVCWHNLGDAGFPDRILWMQAAAKLHPEMDLTRVGIYGTSAGGQDALRAVEAFGDFYKVAVADCGCHDNRMDKIWWNELWMGWPIGPWYAEQSNVTNAKDLHGALLLIVGETDHNVDPASTMQVVNALIKADKDFDLLVIPNADHGQDGAYGDRRRKDFFVRHLLGVEPRVR